MKPVPTTKFCGRKGSFELACTELQRRQVSSCWSVLAFIYIFIGFCTLAGG